MKTETKKSPRVAIILVALLALMQLVRITAYSIIQDSLTGVNAEAWLFPAMMDVFIGTCALFVALGIWRGKGLLPWVSAIVFYALSISDHMDAVSVLLTSKGARPAAISPSMVPMLLVMSLVEAAAIWTLSTKSMRDHYFKLISEGSITMNDTTKPANWWCSILAVLAGVLTNLITTMELGVHNV